MLGSLWRAQQTQSYFSSKSSPRHFRGLKMLLGAVVRVEKQRGKKIRFVSPPHACKAVLQGLPAPFHHTSYIWETPASLVQHWKYLKWLIIVCIHTPDACFLNKQTNRNLKYPLWDGTFFEQLSPDQFLVQDSRRRFPQLPKSPLYEYFSSLPLPHKSSRCLGGVEVPRDVTAAYFHLQHIREGKLGGLQLNKADGTLN